MSHSSALPDPQPVSFFFLAVIAAAILVTILLVVIPSDLFLAFSNYLQIIAALAGALVLLYCGQRAGRQQLLLWAGAGFGIWGIANIGWYALTFLGFRSEVFPSLIDAGLILGLLLLAVGLWTGRPGTVPAPAIVITILVLSLSVPSLMLLSAGFSLPAAAVTYCYFAVSGLLIAGGLITDGRNRTLLIPGVLLIGLAFMIYPLREIYLATDPLFLAIGTMVCAGFSFIVLGLMPVNDTSVKA